jgi:hypothetical protein
MGRLRGGVDLRKIAHWLADNQESYNGGDFVEATQVRGVRGLWAELLVLAWNHEDGDPMNWRALSLLSLTDSQLRGLRRWLGPLTSETARSNLDELLSRDQSTAKRKPLLATMANARTRQRLERAQAAVRKEEAERVAEQEREAQSWRKHEMSRREANLRRLRTEIEQALRRAETMPEYQGRGWALSLCLESHVSETGALPEGRVHLGWPELREIDCDALFAHTSGNVEGKHQATEPNPDAQV